MSTPNVAAEWVCTAEEYHADNANVSRSMLDIFLKAPLDYRDFYVTESRQPPPPTPAMITGTLSHLFILEPDRLKTGVVVIPQEVLAKNGARSTNAYKDFAAAHADKLLVKADEFDQARALVDCFWADPIVKKHFRSGVAERTIAWQDNETGLGRKCRLDFSRPEVIFDIKTTTDTRPAAFVRSVGSMGYHRQRSFYCDGIEALTGERPAFVFVAVNKDRPGDVAFHELDEEFDAIGRQHVRKLLNELADAIQYDDWRAPHHRQINKLSPPAWLANATAWEIDT